MTDVTAWRAELRFLDRLNQATKHVANANKVQIQFIDFDCTAKANLLCNNEPGHGFTATVTLATTVTAFTTVTSSQATFRAAFGARWLTN